MSKKLQPIQLNWGEKNTEVKSQNSMTSPENPYNHLSQLEKTEEVNDYEIMFRGNDNVAPQKDLQLGLRSITHKKIAQKLARLVSGQGIEFYVKNPESGENELLNDTERLQLEYAQTFKDIGLHKAIQVVANGIVYQNLSSIVTTSGPVEIIPGIDDVVNRIKFIQAYPSERLRFSKYVMNEFGEEIVEYHFYHNNWGYDRTKEHQKPKLPEIVSIKEYIRLSSSRELDNEAFAVKTYQADKAWKETHVSFPFILGDGIFDNAYPMPEWKSDSSINDIQSEFEASCIRIDYLRNGLHIFAIVNVYSAQFTTTNDNDYNAPDENWAESLDIVKGLKGSFNSGRVIVNPVGTTDVNLDGKIKVESIKLEFPVQQSEYFNQEARAGILTAWGVMADLFSISKPEKNNLRSQGEFLKIGVMLLQQDVRIYQEAIEEGFQNILNFYGLTRIAARMKSVKSSIFFAVMADLAKEVLTKDELRDFIFGLGELDETQREEIFNSVINEQNNNSNNNQNENEDDMSGL